MEMEARSKTMRVSGKHGAGMGGRGLKRRDWGLFALKCWGASRNLSPTR